MTRPTINVNSPTDSDPIGEGAERIRETRQALYDIFPIKKEDLDPGMKPDGSVSKEYVDEQDQLLQDQIDSNKGNIESNATDIGINAGNIASNAIDISNNSDSISNNASAIAINAGNILTNSGDIADLDVRVTQNEDDIAALEAEMPDAGIQLDNSEPWTHAQYNTLIDASITNDGTAMPRAMLGSIQSNPNQKISPASGGAFTLCNVFGDTPTKVGIYANLLLDPVASYTFDVNNFLVNEIDEEKWLYVRLMSEGGKWNQVGSNYLGEPGGLGDTAMWEHILTVKNPTDVDHINFENVFTADYEIYKVIMQNVHPVTIGDIRLKLGAPNPSDGVIPLIQWNAQGWSVQGVLSGGYGSTENYAKIGIDSVPESPTITYAGQNIEMTFWQPYSSSTLTKGSFYGMGYNSSSNHQLPLVGGFTDRANIDPGGASCRGFVINGVGGIQGTPTTKFDIYGYREQS